ncbi:hypothetical protein [Methylomonas rhizoryzae]|uniref:hypothetical protein n=1 Tax=Methylomonas rhizoryzae TaxID=2608981 RepID=UPI001E4C4D30|nr:hypothetical protein [Methylomonas rhizoryzae]
MAISLLVGNLFYALQARRLAQESGPSDATALPGLIGLWAPNYDYDAGGRLIEARYPNGIDQTLVWNADDSLNKIAHKKGGTVTRPSGQSCTGSNQSQYQYDSFQRLNQIQVNGTTTGQYRYDHQGRRIQKTEGATVTNYLYDGPNIYAEYSGTNWYSPSAV